MRTYFLSLIGLTTLSFCLGISSAAAAPRSAPVAVRDTRQSAQWLVTPGVSAVARLARVERQSAAWAEIWRGIETPVRGVQPRRTLMPHRRFSGRPAPCDGRAPTITGTDGNDVIKGTPGRDVIAGLAGDDQIYGLGQDDVICGGSGDDVIWGGAGNDRMFGGDGHDLIDAGLGNDTSDGGPDDRDGATFWDASGPITASLVTGTATGEGSDIFTNMEELHGGNYNDTLTGDAGSNTLFGLDGNDVLNGGDGTDFLHGGEGNDAIDGGPGQFDAIGFYAAAGPISASLVTGTSSGQGNDTFTNVESLFGGDYGDTLIGNDGDNWVFGNGGDDKIYGNGGNDFLDGDAGDDTMDGGPGGFDSVAFFDAPGSITASLASGTASGDGADTFSNIEQIQGSNYADTLSGGAADGWLSGNGGDDTINGGSGNEFLFAGPGDDTISGGVGDDFLAPGSGIDTLDGGPGFDKAAYWDASGPITASLETNSATGDGTDTYTTIEGIHGGDYGDTITGSSADEEFFGNGGDDTIRGNGGNDFIAGNDGNDNLAGGDGSDFLMGGPADDALDGGPGLYDGAVYFDATGPVTASLATGTATGQGSDTFQGMEQIVGGPFDDTLTGSSDPNEAGLDGQAGNDVLNGGSANEGLSGGPGNDTISGGGGDDFVAPGSGTDTLDGGPGFDKAAYWDASGPITASLVTNTATGDGMDTYTSIEGIHGGNYGDMLTGSSADEEFFGNGGDDTIYAGAGNDTLNGADGNDSLYGEAGNDYLDGADGVDFLDGGPDWDTCVNGETTINCEA